MLCEFTFYSRSFYALSVIISTYAAILYILVLMYYPEPKKASRKEKIKLFRDLFSLFPDLKTGDQQNARMILIRFFSLVFGFENMVIDQHGVIYNVSGQEELLSLLMATTSIQKWDKNQMAWYQDFFINTDIPGDDLNIYIKIFSKLKELGFDFKYEIPVPSGQVQNGVDLERADRLIDALKNFLAESQSNDKFIDELNILHNIDLPKIQEQLREQMLHKKVGELAPDKILVAYYKVYQKLPQS
jgi:hypothetical protein